MISEPISIEYLCFWAINNDGEGMACRTKGGRGKAGMPSKSDNYQSNLNIVEMDSSYSIYSLSEFTKS